MAESEKSAANRDVMRSEFARQSETFADPSLNGAFIDRLEQLVEFAVPGPEDVCLDVACGSGLVARGLAARARHVTGIDATPEMLRTGKTQADAAGERNTVFQLGDAAALPFLDDSFTLVITRFSLHHIGDPRKVAEEMVRVCRPGGRVIVADLVSRSDLPGDPDRLERMRDPSHGAMLSVEEITDLLISAGAQADSSEVFDVRRPLRTWLEQALTPETTASRIEREVAEELDGATPTGLRPLLVDAQPWFTQTWAHIAVTVE